MRGLPDPRVMAHDTLGALLVLAAALAFPFVLKLVIGL